MVIVKNVVGINDIVELVEVVDGEEVEEVDEGSRAIEIGADEKLDELIIDEEVVEVEEVEEAEEGRKAIEVVVEEELDELIIDEEVEAAGEEDELEEFKLDAEVDELANNVELDDVATDEELDELVEVEELDGLETLVEPAKLSMLIVLIVVAVLEKLVVVVRTPCRVMVGRIVLVADDVVVMLNELDELDTLGWRTALEELEDEEVADIVVTDGEDTEEDGELELDEALVLSELDAVVTVLGRDIVGSMAIAVEAVEVLVEYDSELVIVEEEADDVVAKPMRLIVLDSTYVLDVLDAGLGVLALVTVLLEPLMLLTIGMIVLVLLILLVLTILLGLLMAPLKLVVDAILSLARTASALEIVVRMFAELEVEIGSSVTILENDVEEEVVTVVVTMTEALEIKEDEDSPRADAKFTDAARVETRLVLALPTAVEDDAVDANETLTIPEVLVDVEKTCNEMLLADVDVLPESSDKPNDEVEETGGSETDVLLVFVLLDKVRGPVLEVDEVLVACPEELEEAVAEVIRIVSLVCIAMLVVVITTADTPSLPPPPRLRML